jgi:hypothetical protein
MDNAIKQIIYEFQQEYHAKIVYITMYGSKLFGTDNPNSDTDYKGIFIPSKEDVLLKRDIEHYNYNSNIEGKNAKEDVDLQLYSIYKWFTLLRKGETGALDLLFSIFREETQMYNDRAFTDIIKEYYSKFYNRNLHSFVGYCIGQSKMYNIKGKRFAQLHSFVEIFGQIAIADPTIKLREYFPHIEKILAEQSYQDVKFVKASVARGNQAYREGRYIELLGKRFAGSTSVGYFAQKITEMEVQFGQRARSSAEGVDFKALSHAVRVLNEVEELLDEGFITFPLKNRVYVTAIKEGRETLEHVMAYLDIKLDEVQQKLEQSSLPEKSDEALMQRLLLAWIDR